MFYIIQGCQVWITYYFVCDDAYITPSTNLNDIIYNFLPSSNNLRKTNISKNKLLLLLMHFSLEKNVLINIKKQT